MSRESVELLAQLSAGADGVAYRGRAAGGEPVELRTLTGAWADSLRRESVVRRLRLAKLLDHPGAQRIRELHLERQPPCVVLDPLCGPTLAEHLCGRRPLPLIEALALALDLAALLHAAHRLGLGHGQLSPKTIHAGTACLVQVDFTGLLVRPNEQPGVMGQDDCAADVTAVAALLAWLLGDGPFRPDASLAHVAPAPAQALLSDALKRSAEERPTIAELEDRLRQLLAIQQQQAGLDVTNPAVESAEVSLPAIGQPQRGQLGRFRLLEKLGQGGMGEVWRAEDTSDGRIVAIKTLLPEYARRPEALQRFRKEARLLAEVNNPYVTSLLEVNEDAGVHYLAVEFIAGQSLARKLEAGKPLEESFALAIMADVCRALVDAHVRGIIHRDIKPDNILLPAGSETADPALTVGAGDARVLAKLSDFGLARHVVESDSMHLTRTGAVVGTPLYLSPEQCTGAAVDPRSDVYGIGATLFHLLAGRPPFVGENPLVLINHHCNTPVPDLKALNPALSDSVCQLVVKALAKAPAHRHADAGELLRDINRVLRGEPATLAVHPLLPRCDPDRVLHYDFRWELTSSPRDLWPHVSNTERLNRAIHLPAIEFTTRPDESGRVRRSGRIRKLGLEVAWEEHPFEWVEGRRFGVLRECSAGPFRWLLSVVELQPRPGGGTVLTHRVRVEPTGLLGRTFAAVEVGVKTRRALDRVYRRIDLGLVGAASRAAPGTFADPFEEPARLTRAQEKRLDEAVDRLAARGVDLAVATRLGEYLATASAQEVARIRPIALARRLGLDADAVIAACLHGTRAGLLVSMWDLICPLCRIPSQVLDTLKAVEEHGRCEACNADYKLDFGRSVELIFRPDPSIRDAELGTYCVGGPAHSPHVVAQVRVVGGERIELEVDLGEGAYRLRGPQLRGVVDLRVQPGPHPARWEGDLGHFVGQGEPVLLRPGGQVLAVTNPHAQELVVRLERAADRDDALTAARAAALALFRELFPGEVLSPGQLVSVTAVVLLASEVAGLETLAEGDAFVRLHGHLRAVETVARHHGGALVKAVSDGGLVAFHEPAAAIRALLALDGAGVRLALHRGPALAATINDHLDYFGTTVRQVGELVRLAQPGERLVSQTVMDDPAVSAVLAQEGARSEVVRTEGPVGVVQRLTPRAIGEGCEPPGLSRRG
jgi:serine/threonine protein kinase/class 3 adenylate cyclase